MKRVTKKVLSALLAIIIIATSMPFTAFAVEENTKGNQNVSTDVGDMSLTATNPIAEVITEELEKSSTEETADYVITDLKFNGKVATVYLGVVADCTVVVAIYSEAGQMLATGITTASQGIDSVDVTVDIDSMPEYFIAQAFLLDEDYAPLCPEFTTIEEMQCYEEFMEKSVDDFDADDVIINFDEQKDDNFAVLADGGSAVFGSTGKNILVSADYENEIYEFENIDSDISSLSIGDVFYYEYNDEMLIINVTGIDINGTSATVTGDKSAELEDYFSFVKIDISTETNGNDFTVNNEGVEEGIEYIGNEKWEDEVVDDDFSTFAVIGDAAEISCPVWKLSLEKLTGQIKASVEYDIKIHYDPLLLANSIIIGTNNPILGGVFSYNAYKSVKAVFDFKIKGTVSLTGELQDFIFLGTLDFVTPVGIVCSVGFRLMFSLSAAVTFTIAEISQTIGFDYKKDGEIKNLCTKPRIDITPSLSGKLEGSVGLRVSPSISFIKLIEVSINPEVGVKAEMTLFDTDGDDIENHLCKICFDGELKFYVSVDLVGEIFGKNIGQVELAPEYEKHLKDFYYSVTYNDFGWGECPYSTESDGNGGNNGNGDNNEVGDLIEFGSYPQTEVTDTSLLSALNSLSLSWKSYGYYSGTGDWDDGQMTPGDWMKYADITYKGERYRAVKFTEYRPYVTGYKTSSSNTYQDDNGYYTNTVYWFKFEPLQWRVIDPDEGFMVCENTIDSQAYNNTIYWNGSELYQNTSCMTYVTDYAESSIREWLNDDFYNTAFTSSEKTEISTTTCDNSSYYNSAYGSVTTYDKIFLLSYWDTLNTNYGFSSSYSLYDTARRSQGTDYAKCQGLDVHTIPSEYKGNSRWLLRTSGGSSYSVCYVDSYGSVSSTGSNVRNSNYGVRPALKLNPKSGIFESYGEQSGTVSFETEGEAEFTTQSVATDSMSIYNKNCIAGNRYVLLNVSNYSEDFELNSDDLLYIDMLRADVNGTVSAAFTPKSYDENGTILLIGDFGNGTEVREITKDEPTPEPEPDPEPEIKGKVHSVSINDISMSYKDSATVTPTVNADSGVKYTVSYSSSNNDVVSVDSNGRLTTNDKGSATITVTVTDEYGNTVTDTCNVNVSYKWWQWIIVIVLFGWIWY